MHLMSLGCVGVFCVCVLNVNGMCGMLCAGVLNVMGCVDVHVLNGYRPAA